MTGWLVAFEGLDGAGKSTQLGVLGEQLTRRSVDWLSTREPTDGPWGRRIRESAQSKRMSPMDELNAFVADRRQHVDEVIAPALAAGRVVLIDRYYFSTVAYQGARGLDIDMLHAANAFAPEPDLMFVFDLDPAIGLARVAARGGADLFEKEEEQRRVRQIFSDIKLAAVDGRQRLYRIDASRKVDAIADQIWTRTRELLGLPQVPS